MQGSPRPDFFSAAQVMLFYALGKFLLPDNIQTICFLQLPWYFPFHPVSMKVICSMSSLKQPWPALRCGK